jgi:nitrogen PTS system EIIA component
MDLKVKDVANLLNVSETTIRRWVSEKKIPCYTMNQSHFFDRGEIESWLMSQKGIDSKSENGHAKSEPSENGLRGGIRQFSLFRAIHKGIVLHDVPGTTKEEVIRAAVKTIAKHLNLDAEVLTDVLLERENLMPTALNNGIGIPHARDFLLNDHCDVVVVAYPKEAVDYGALDGKPVHTLFFLLACDDKRHLQILAKIAHFTFQSQTTKFLAGQPSKEKLLDFIKQWESTILPVNEA